MCLTPIFIDNPNYGLKNYYSRRLKDTLSHRIAVPCGHCPTCLALKQNYQVQRFETESLDNDLWAVMLSYSNDALPTCIINGYKHRYADTRDIQLLIKRLRKYDVFPKGTRYWFISERGGKHHRPHWHGMFSTPKIRGSTLAEIYSREKFYHDTILENWYTNKGSTRAPIKVPNLIYYNKNGRRNYDFHYLDPKLTLMGVDDCAFYNTKYLLKDDKYTQSVKSALFFNLPEDSFKFYWNLLRNKTLCSHYLGDIHNPVVIDYIRFCFDFSHSYKMPYPCFINPNSGQTFPMAPYYRRKFTTIDDALRFREYHDELYYEDTGTRVAVDIDLDSVKKKYARYEKVLKQVNFRDIHCDMLYDSTIYDNYGDFEKPTELLEIPSDNWESDFFD